MPYARLIFLAYRLPNIYMHDMTLDMQNCLPITKSSPVFPFKALPFPLPF